VLFELVLLVATPGLVPCSVEVVNTTSPTVFGPSRFMDSRIVRWPQVSLCQTRGEENAYRIAEFPTFKDCMERVAVIGDEEPVRAICREKQDGSAR
jgi:hypothetical protein